ncbi:MAG: HEAT repeat domain-containing protein, partial [Thermodesulfobacteriota bacterium]|nr:HEAT repeat domain-containing protein [Thermodesulfobacteriota bacterium]
MSSFRKQKAQLSVVLKAPDWEHGLFSLLDQVPAQKLIPPLLSFLSYTTEIKWRAITGLGLVVSRLERENRNKAIGVMRRLLCAMQRNSSNSGWGVAEAMGEIAAMSEPLAKRYHKPLISYIQNPKVSISGNNYIEHPQLRQGAYWGLARLSQVRPELTAHVGPELLDALPKEGDPSKGLICWTLGSIKAEQAKNTLLKL